MGVLGQQRCDFPPHVVVARGSLQQERITDFGRLIERRLVQVGDAAPLLTVHAGDSGSTDTSIG